MKTRQIVVCKGTTVFLWCQPPNFTFWRRYGRNGKSSKWEKVFVTFSPLNFLVMTPRCGWNGLFRGLLTESSPLEYFRSKQESRSRSAASEMCISCSLTSWGLIVCCCFLRQVTFLRSFSPHMPYKLLPLQKTLSPKVAPLSTESRRI